MDTSAFSYRCFFHLNNKRDLIGQRKTTIGSLTLLLVLKRSLLEIDIEVHFQELINYSWFWKVGLIIIFI